MLERNNGITFRAAHIEDAGNSNDITLQQAAIVNGCQTTMCLVKCGTESADCLVQVKVVEADDAWDIAKSANYQNTVARIELDLARYLRPQLVQKAATDLGYGLMSKEDSPGSILDTIYQEQVDYHELKCLYLGFFSRKPNNLFDDNYTELRADLLEVLYRDSGNEKELFATLFLVLKQSRKALDWCYSRIGNKEYGLLFKRFFQDEKPRYRAYLSVLAICGALRVNLADRDSTLQGEVGRMRVFVERARELLENRSDEYSQVFLQAFLILADSALEASSTGSDAEVAQAMFHRISKSSFTTLYTKLLMHVDLRPPEQTQHEGFQRKG
jgi:hypothetical protein